MKPKENYCNNDSERESDTGRQHGHVLTRLGSTELALFQLLLGPIPTIERNRCDQVDNGADKEQLVVQEGFLG